MITKDKFIAYEKVRRSGVTNMFNVSVVSQFSGLDHKEILEIMKNYSKFKKEFLK